jgi:hypothetical protein
MADLEKFRTRASYCVHMAEKAEHPEAKRSWKILAEGWRSMLPIFERASEKEFVRGRATRQESSTLEE